MAFGTMSIGNAGFTKKFISALFLLMHPVGTPYASETPTSPAELYGGTWERIENCTIWGASDTHPAGTTVEAGLPSVFGQINELLLGYGAQGSGMLKLTYNPISFADFSTGSGIKVYRSNIGLNNTGIYGASDTVQPPAYCMYIWRRVA